MVSSGLFLKSVVLYDILTFSLKILGRALSLGCLELLSTTSWASSIWHRTPITGQKDYK